LLRLCIRFFDGSGAFTLELLRFRRLHIRFLKFKCLHTRHLWYRCLHTRVLKFRCLHTRCFLNQISDSYFYFYYRPNIKIVTECQEYAEEYCNNYDKVSQRKAFFMEDIQYSTFNTICRGSALKLKRFRKDTTITALLTYKNSFIYEFLDNLLQKTIPFGIPQHLMSFHYFMLFKYYEVLNVKDPKVLTIDDLSFGFVLWLIACGISVIGFFMELLSFKLRKVLRNFIGLWMLLSILRWRLKNVVL